MVRSIALTVGISAGITALAACGPSHICKLSGAGAGHNFETVAPFTDGAFLCSARSTGFSSVLTAQHRADTIDEVVAGYQSRLTEAGWKDIKSTDIPLKGEGGKEYTGKQLTANNGTVGFKAAFSQPSTTVYVDITAIRGPRGR